MKNGHKKKAKKLADLLAQVVPHSTGGNIR